ncbi:hypothetical protein B296_00029648 [Ensete ventricosum]|uniref:Uncharacterized protein n=1 Tax=Ensete ventricosum TaxID=4639 RepID=A0A426ZFU2_ENSVE|nr:hypothetical protein B296_00029648 [Ensete ventricosum]
MLGQSQVRASSRGLDDVVGTHRDTRRKLAEGIKGLSRVCREIARSDQELAKKASRVHRKKTKRLAGRLSGVVEKLVGRAAAVAIVVSGSNDDGEEKRQSSDGDEDSSSDSGWLSRLRLLRSWRISNFSLILFTVVLLMSGSNSLRASLHLEKKSRFPCTDKKSSRLLLPVQVRRSRRCIPLFLVTSDDEKATRGRPWRRNCRPEVLIRGTIPRFSNYRCLRQPSRHLAVRGQ